MLRFYFFRIYYSSNRCILYFTLYLSCSCFPSRPGGLGPSHESNYECYTKGDKKLTRGRAQRPGWPNSQLPFRNLLFYDVQTLRLLVFIMFWPNFCKIELSEGCGRSLLIETSKNFENEKFSSAWKLLKLTTGSTLGRRERFWTWKLISFFKVKPIFRG